jgi:hypothetical protein
MGTNALENIKYISDNRIVRTKRTKYACDWHIWKNYGYTLFLIIATKSISENRKLYDECIHNIHSNLVKVLIHSELGLKMKLKMLVQGLFPIWWAKRDLKKQQAALKADMME